MAQIPTEAPTDWALKITQCAQQAVAEAIERHRRLGESIVIWRDGEIVTLTAEEIPPQNLEQPKEFKTDA